MHLGRVLCPRLPHRRHRLQLFIFDPDKFLRLLQDLPGFRDDKTDRVSHTPRHAPLFNHYIPVLLKVPHLVIGHIFRCENRQHSREGLRFLRIDLQHSRPGISGPHRRRIDHVLQLHIVRVFSIPQNLFPHIQPERFLSHAVLLALLQRFLDLLIAPQDRSRKLDSLDDLFISGTAADISLKSCFYLFLRRVRHPVYQSLSRHDHSRDAESALNRTFGSESIDKCLFLRLAQPLCGDDTVSRGQFCSQHAGFYRISVHDNGTGAAGSLAASVLDRVQMKIIPQIPEQRFLPVCAPQNTVYHKAIILFHILTPALPGL